MIVHLFTCDSQHKFYLPLDLPKPLDEIAIMFTHIICPLCQSKNIKINLNEYEVGQI